MAAGPPPAWVLARIREYIADGLKTPAIAAQLSHNGYPCTWRQVKRWRFHDRSMHQIWQGSDAQLDALWKRGP